MLPTAIVLITAALILYTSGVWLEHRDGTLTRRHVLFFAAGLICDASGTGVMARIAASKAAPTGTAGLLTQIMSVTGAAALVLMALHLAWALFVLWRDRAPERLAFHKFSLAVWALWLVPYFTGMAGSMVGGRA